MVRSKSVQPHDKPNSGPIHDSLQATFDACTVSRAWWCFVQGAHFAATKALCMSARSSRQVMCTKCVLANRKRAKLSDLLVAGLGATDGHHMERSVSAVTGPAGHFCRKPSAPCTGSAVASPRAHRHCALSSTINLAVDSAASCKYLHRPRTVAISILAFR